MSKITEKRDLRAKLRKERADKAKVLAEKIDTRRAKAEERRKSIHKRKGDKARIQDFTKKDPNTPEREKAIEAKELALKKEMDYLHTLIVADGDRIDELDRKIEALDGWITKAGKRIGRLTKSIRKLVRKAQRKTGADKALARAKKDDGKTEQPPGSNWGGIVQKMITFTGYAGPVYWCGCAVCFWTIKYGLGEISSKIRRGYAGYVEADARANTNGLRLVDKPAKGGVGSLWNNEHVVMTTGRVIDGMVETDEGNTSDTTGGSQTNGDSCSALKRRNFSDFDCFAEQVY